MTSAAREDYVARQLRRWYGQWEKSKTRELPAIDRVHERLSARIPAQDGVSIVHGDYRLDNMILADSGEVAAVVDWELCTLGDPMADVGTLMAYWPDREQAGSASGSPPTWHPASPAAPRSPAATPRPPAATSPNSTSTSPSATGSWRSSSRASSPGWPPAATAGRAPPTPASTPSPDGHPPRRDRRSGRVGRLTSPRRALRLGRKPKCGSTSVAGPVLSGRVAVSSPDPPRLRSNP